MTRAMRQDTVEQLARQLLGAHAVVIRRREGWTAAVIVNPYASGPPWPVETRYVAETRAALADELRAALADVLVHEQVPE